jgi:hypothetical protein
LRLPGDWQECQRGCIAPYLWGVRPL